MMKCSLVYSPLWLANIHFAALFLSRCSLCLVWLSLSLCRFLRDERERANRANLLSQIYYSHHNALTLSPPSLVVLGCWEERSKRILPWETLCSITHGECCEGGEWLKVPISAYWHCWWLWSQVKGILERWGGSAGSRWCCFGWGESGALTVLCTQSVVVVVDRVVLLCLDVVVVLFLRTRRRS